MSRSVPPAADAWSDARRRLAQLELSAAKMSSAWFLGMSGLFAAAALFIASALILAALLVRMQDHFGSTQHGDSVLAETSGLTQALDESAAAARGFVATSDSGLVGVREQAKRAIGRHLAALGGMVRGDGEAERIVHTVAPVIGRRRAMLDEMIALARQSDGTQRIQAGEMQRIGLARSIGGELGKLRNHERKLIAVQQNLVRFDIRLAIALVLLTAVIAPACGLAGIWVLQRERDSQRGRELQLELMHVQRLGIMGQTAAMLAHEINQPLTAANNFLAALRRTYAEAPDKVPGLLDRIGQQIQRASSILGKLRHFIAKRENERTAEMPDILIEDAVVLLGTIDASVTLKTQIANDLPAVMVDRVQLQQVLVNLMRNAIEAMRDSPRRELTLAVAAASRDSVEISVSDTGPGLPKEVAAQLFEPFVSTKPEGMGVGLSICRSIIAQHGGRIWADPNPDGGTAFRFVLPAIEERAAA